MAQCSNENFMKICQSINVQAPNKLEPKKIPVLKGHDGSVPGFMSSLTTISKKSNQQHLLGNSPEEQALVRQWLEYAVTNVNHVDTPHVLKQVLRDINRTLAGRTYIAGNAKSLADIVLYHFLFQVVSNLTFQEKEQHMHLSRWFSNLQQDCNIRGSNSLLHFSRTPLY